MFKFVKYGLRNPTFAMKSPVGTMEHAMDQTEVGALYASVRPDLG